MWQTVISVDGSEFHMEVTLPGLPQESWTWPISCGGPRWLTINLPCWIQSEFLHNSGLFSAALVLCNQAGSHDIFNGTNYLSTWACAQMNENNNEIEQLIYYFRLKMFLFHHNYLEYVNALLNRFFTEVKNMQRNGSYIITIRTYYFQHLVHE